MRSASQWISGHALPLVMALGAAGFVILVSLRGLPPVMRSTDAALQQERS